MSKYFHVLAVIRSHPYSHTPFSLEQDRTQKQVARACNVDNNFAQINHTSFLLLMTHPQWVPFPFHRLPPPNTHLAQSSSPSSSYSNASTSSSLSISSLPNYSNADLNAKSYLNSSELVIPNPFNFCPGDKIGAIICAVTLSKSRMRLRSGARMHRVLNKVPSLFMAAQVFLFPFLFPRTPNSTYE